MGTPAGRPMDEEERAKHEELMAMLAAGRELGPDMDRAVVESYMEKQKTPRVPAPRREPSPPVDWNGMAQSIVPVIAIVAVISVLAVSHAWMFFWLIFPLMGWAFGGWRGGHDRYRRRTTYYDDMGRRISVRERGYGPLPPSRDGSGGDGQGDARQRDARDPYDHVMQRAEPLVR